MDSHMNDSFDSDEYDAAFYEILDYIIKEEKREEWRRRRRPRPNFLTKWSDAKFRTEFRLSKDVVRFVIAEISDAISSRRDRSYDFTPAEMVFLTLKFLATGSYSNFTGGFLDVNNKTTCKIIQKVTKAIASLRDKYVDMPKGQEVNKVREGFYKLGKFPRCIGALDGTHVQIEDHYEPNYKTSKNGKTFYSLNVQLVSDADLKIRNIVCRTPGATRDSQVFNDSKLKQDFDGGEFGDNLMVADGGYAVEPYLITPLSNPKTPAEKLFNEAHEKTHVPVRRLSEVWKRRFPILALEICLDMVKIEAMIVTCAVLHNIAVLKGDAEPPEASEEVETGIKLTSNVHNDIVVDVGDGKDSLRRELITQHFQNML